MKLDTCKVKKRGIGIDVMILLDKKVRLNLLSIQGSKFNTYIKKDI